MRLRPAITTPITLGLIFWLGWLGTNNVFLTQEHVAYSMGFLVAIWTGHVATNWVVGNMWNYLRWRHPYEAKGYLETYRGQGAIVGIVERTLYYGSLIVGQAVFIGLWFTLKTIAQSPRWGKDSGPIQGRGIFQPFLAGTGLSLLFAGGGYLMTYLILKNERLGLNNSIFIGLGLVLTWALCMFVSYKAVKELKIELRKKLVVRDT